MTADSGKLNLNTIGQIAVSVSDIDRATEFYRDTLGMRFLFSAPPGMSFFDCDGVRLMLAVPERGAESQKGNSVIYYTVEGRPAGDRHTESSRRRVHRRAARYPQHGCLRPLDVVLHRSRRQHPRPHG